MKVVIVRMRDTHKAMRNNGTEEYMKNYKNLTIREEKAIFKKQ